MRKIILTSILFLLLFNSAYSQEKARIMVAPFVNSTKDKELDFLSSGFPETLILGLKNSKEIILVERNQIDKIMKEKQLQISGFIDEKTAIDVGKEVYADFVITGSFNKEGDNLTVNSKVIKIDDGKITEIEPISYQYPDGIFDLQDKLAEKILQSLNIVVSEFEKERISKSIKSTGSVSAYECYVKGKEEFMKMSLPGYLEAIKWYEKALSLDKNYFFAYVGITDAYGMLALYKNDYPEDVRVKEKVPALVAKVMDYLEKGAKIEGESAEKYSLLSWLYNFKEQKEESLKFLKKAIDLAPNNDKYWYDLWNRDPKESNNPESIYAKKALEVNPNNYLVYLNKAIILQSMGKIDEAIEAAKKSVELNRFAFTPHIQLAILYEVKKDVENQEKEYKLVLEIDPEFLPALTNLANIYFNAGKIDEAIKLYKKVLNLNPEHFNANYNLGFSYHHKGDLDEAIKYYRKAIDIDPFSTDATRYFNLGAAYKDKNDYDNAIEYFKKALDLEPKHFNVNLNLGICYHQKGNFDEAIKYLKKEIEINPSTTDIDLYFYLGAAYKDKGDCDNAIEYFKKMLDLNPTDFDANLNLGLCYHEKGNLDEAIKYYKKSIEIAPLLARNRNIYYSLALAYQGKGEYNDAIENFKKAIELAPKDYVIHIDLGVAYYLAGDLKSATQETENSIKINPNDDVYKAQAHYNLACMYSLQNEKEPAIKNLKEAIRIDAKYKEAAKNDKDKDLKNISSEKEFIEIVK